MQLEKFLVSLLVFVFAAFLFPTLQTECSNAATTDLAQVINLFPTIFIVIIAIFPVYYGLSGGKS